MTRHAIILTLIATGVVASAFFPILLPSDMLNALDVIFGLILQWDGILPAVTLFACLAFIALLELAIFVYKLFKWVVGS